VPEAITVAGSDLKGKFNTTQDAGPEEIYQYSNTGTCVDLFAPGVDIAAACGSASASPLLKSAQDHVALIAFAFAEHYIHRE
jgi:hypothetical protein